MSSTEFFIKAFLTFFVIIGPLDLMVIFATLTAKESHLSQKSIALKSNVIAFLILLSFSILGSKVLSSIGISLSSLKISGGLLLMVISYKMVFDNDNHSTDYGVDEEKEAKSSRDLHVFPLATPLIAGGGSISATILFAADTDGSFTKEALLIASFGSVLIINFLLFLVASKAQKMLGNTLTNIITRVMGILLGALSVQFIIDGVKSIATINIF